MDAATLGCVFEPFVSGAGTDANTARQDGRLGTGLGLSTSRQLIERAGGSITARSEVGEGTVFTIDLPSASAVQVRNSA